MDTSLNQRAEEVSTVMQQVQACFWSPFKINEIVTLEKCLQEAAIEDPRIGLLFKKLARESVFVEPFEKSRYLARSEAQQREDHELRRKILSLRDAISKIDAEIGVFETKTRDLAEQEARADLAIQKLDRALVQNEQACVDLKVQFDWTLGRVMKSFELTTQLVNNCVLDLIDAWPSSSLAKQVQMYNCNRQKILNELMGLAPPNNSQMVSLFSTDEKMALATGLANYLTSLEDLVKDMSLIENAFQDKLPNELEMIKDFRKHIEYFKQPSGVIAKCVLVKYYPIDLSGLPKLKAAE